MEASFLICSPLLVPTKEVHLKRLILWPTLSVKGLAGRTVTADANMVAFVCTVSGALGSCKLLINGCQLVGETVSLFPFSIPHAVLFHV